MNLSQTFFKVFLGVAILVCTVSIASAQNGDQLLDGIGETGLSARYMLNGNFKDWSRNNYHARAEAAAIEFVNDGRFGQVLSLSGKSSSYFTLPELLLSDVESLSVSVWVYLRSEQPGQYLFDFGKDANQHVYSSPLGLKDREGFQVCSKVGANPSQVTAPKIALHKWVFLTMVMDVPSKSMRLYEDGKAVANLTDVQIDLPLLFRSDSKANKLYIGRSLTSEGAPLNALLHDLRIYRIPLSAGQIAGIYRNASGAAQGNAVNVGKQEDHLQQFTTETPQLYNAYLARVEDVQVETQVGHLPKLPNFIPGIYRNKASGPKVRVLWIYPTDNSAVLKTGTYTIIGRVPGTNFQPRAVIKVSHVKASATPKLKLQSFPLSKVELSADANGKDSKFIENRDKFLTTLAKTDPNSFLYMFRHTFGQPQPAGTKPLGVWDTEETKLRGHATGHYLSAIAQAYASTGYNRELQDNFSKKMEAMVNSLYEMSQLSGRPQAAGGVSVSDPGAVPYGPGKSVYDSDLSKAGIRGDYWNWGKGFISAYPPDQFIMLESGAKYGGQKSQIWAPYYTLHKILAGLIDVYEVSGNKKALSIATNMGDWVYARLSRLSQETLIKMWNTYIAGEYGGMNESMAHLYRITGNPNYLKTARLFDNIKVFYGDTAHSHGLAKNVDLFRGLHANQHIPQVVGSIEMYRASGDPDYYRIADNFWNKMTNDYMYSIGGVAGARNPANAECFVAQPSTLYENGFSDGGQNETCATYNMLKLTGDLFLYSQRGELMDYYERGLYNHILSSVAEDSPANTYHVPLRPGSLKQFSNGDMTGFTCCNGTAIESSTKLQNSIYFKSIDHKALYVNLFVPSKLHWDERKVTIEQRTNFPKEDFTSLTINGAGTFDLHVRVPGWASKGFFVKINGKEQLLKAVPGTYLKISREWKNGDVIELRMPFAFRLEPVMDQQNIASLFYGPILLAAQEAEPRKDWRKIRLDAEDISRSIKGDQKSLEFSIGDVIFKPFYDSYGRHSVYLDVALK